MNLLKKRHADQRPTPTVQRTTQPRRPEHPASHPDDALRRVHAAADEARKEIAALVQTEHEAIGETIAVASEEAEERLRGATERRIDIEMKQHIEEAESKLRSELKQMVRMEIARVAKASKKARSGDNGNGHGNGGVPIQARARP